jgi:hypothetical protein
MVRVTFHVAGGAIERGEASWVPPHDPGEDMPWLMIDYRLDGGRLGAAIGVRAGATVDYEKAFPKSAAAQVALDVDGHAWRAPWTLFATHVAEDRAKLASGAPAASKPASDANRVVGFWGVIPLAHAGPDQSRNPDLIAAVGHGTRARLTIEGDRGETFGANTFDLAALAMRDQLFSQALAEATAAAKTAGAGGPCSPETDGS